MMLALPAIAALVLTTGVSAQLHRTLDDTRPPAWARTSVDGNDHALVCVHLTVDPGRAGMLGAKYGGRLVSRFSTIDAIVVEVPIDDLGRLAADPLVRWVEPVPPRFEPMALRPNDRNRMSTGIDTLRLPPYELDGSGVTVLVYDSGTARASHLDLSGRVELIDASGAENHSTHVAGTVGGSGVASDGRYEGMAPGVSLLSGGIEGSGNVLYTNPADLEGDYQAAFAVSRTGRLLSNNSIGANVSANGLDCDFLGDYATTAMLLDGFVTGTLGEPMIIVWAAGNERGPSRCGQAYGTIPPPSGAKNPIQVGAVNADDDSITDFTSWGPTDDGRLKPVIVAPGCERDDDEGVTSASVSNPSGYSTLCGTSMASPTVARLAALLVQQQRDLFPSREDLDNATVKMLLAHTAIDLGRPGPDYQYGYGLVRAIEATDAVRADEFTNDWINDGETVGIDLVVPAGAPEARATLAWDDPPALAGSSATLVNDLDLRLIGPGGEAHGPWTLDPNDPEANAERGAPDRLNNIEQVWVPNPTPGVWRVEIIGTGVPVGPQRFAVGAVGLMPPKLEFIPRAPIPETVDPNSTLRITVDLIARQQELVDGSVRARVTTGGLDERIVPASADGDGGFTVEIQIPECGTELAFILEATGSIGGPATLPPIGVFAPAITVVSVPLDEGFATDTGWTVTSDEALTDGAWERGMPAQDGSRGAPTTDADGDGWAVLTGNRVGNSDVDNGTTTLTSPPLDTTGDAVTISYARWFSTTIGQFPAEDRLLVQASPDGQTWRTIDQAGPGGADVTGGWRQRSVLLDPADQSESMRLRFIAEDLNFPSIVEAAIDAVRVERRTCPGSTCVCESDGLPGVTIADLLVGLDDYFAGRLDLDLSGSTSIVDLLLYLECWLVARFDGCP